MTVSASRPALERVGDTAIVALDIDGFDRLEPGQKIAAAYLARAARAGDRIMFAQGHRHHLPILRLLEGIVVARPFLMGDLLDRLTVYLKQLWLHRGNHFLDSTHKFLPAFSPDELEQAAAAAEGIDIGVPAGMTLGAHLRSLAPAIFDPEFGRQLTCKSAPEGHDVVSASAITYYEGLTATDVAGFTGRFPLNSSLRRGPDGIEEHVWRAGGEGHPPGLYARELGRVVASMHAALPHVDPVYGSYLTAAIRYFRTGLPEDFREATHAWVQADPDVDLIIGFLEQYHDPLGQRGEFEGTLHMVDRENASLMRTLAREALWFEARMPWNPAYSRTHIEVTRANASNILTLAGSAAPFGYIGINLPNDTQLRAEAGSKSFLIGNLMRQRRSVGDHAWLRELSPTESDLQRALVHAPRALDLLVALHEVIGHGSGVESAGLHGPAEDHLREYYSTLEEARADLVAGWHLMEPRLIELGLVESPEVVIEGYWEMLRRAFITIATLETPVAEEDHDRGDLLIVNYLLEHGAGVRRFTEGGKTWLAVADLRAMRAGIGELLSQIMRIKAEGDYDAGKALVERYGVRVDPELHRELRTRAQRLGVPTRLAFINPILEPRLASDGTIEDVDVSYPADFLTEQLELSRQHAND